MISFYNSKIDARKRNARNIEMNCIYYHYYMRTMSQPSKLFAHMRKRTIWVCSIQRVLFVLLLPNPYS